MPSVCWFCSALLVNSSITNLHNEMGYGLGLRVGLRLGVNPIPSFVSESCVSPVCGSPLCGSPRPRLAGSSNRCGFDEHEHVRSVSGHVYCETSG